MLIYINSCQPEISWSVMRCSARTILQADSSATSVFGASLENVRIRRAPSAVPEEPDPVGSLSSRSRRYDETVNLQAADATLYRAKSASRNKLMLAA